jgi:hypothetical protein
LPEVLPELALQLADTRPQPVKVTDLRPQLIDELCLGSNDLGLL